MFANRLASAQLSYSEPSAPTALGNEKDSIDALPRLQICKTASDLRDWLASFARDLGFYGARYIHIGSRWPSQGGTSSCPPLRFTATSAFDETDAERWLARDPNAAQARTAFAPFVYTTRNIAGIDALQQTWLENERMRGIAAGIVIPVQDSVDGPAYISLFGNDGPGSRELVDRRAPELAFTAAHFHAKAKQYLPIAGWVPRLTKRELQCLRLAAMGFTTAQSGKELGLSDKTVEYHLARASDKLGATSKLRAVVLAFAQGLVTFQDGPGRPCRRNSSRSRQSR